ncbi:hypothetical protein GCM10010517_60960 [Streptosporangium fragile]|uniref:Uncharacterized protein n=1 Tax=Streptosporangium fragile TaxID=46186 RepID=A0ABN3W5X1_9ACTN
MPDDLVSVPTGHKAAPAGSARLRGRQAAHSAASAAADPTSQYCPPITSTRQMVCRSPERGGSPSWNTARSPRCAPSYRTTSAVVSISTTKATPDGVQAQTSLPMRRRGPRPGAGSCGTVTPPHRERPCDHILLVTTGHSHCYTRNFAA